MKLSEAVEQLKDIKEHCQDQSRSALTEYVIKCSKGDASKLKNELVANKLTQVIEDLEKQMTSVWIPFEAEYDEEYKMDMLQGKIPEEEQEILVSDGKRVWNDTFMRDGTECYLDSGENLITTAKAWQPLPEPYKESDEE